MNYFYITGSSRGLGKAITEELLKDEKNTVFGIARTPFLKSKNYTHHSLDLSDIKKVSDFKFQDHDDAQKIVLINNAATLGEVKHLGYLQDSGIDETLNINISAPAILMNNFIKKYQDHPAQKIIVNITSGAAQSAYDGWSLYCASKAAIDMLSRVAAAEQEMKGASAIKILAIAPGVVDTEMQAEIRSADQQNFSRKQKFIALHEQNELYHAADVAKEFVKILNHPEKIHTVIHRIEL